MSTYSEKLKDPRWQKKRLEILSRDGWKCRCCDSEDSQLQVHHCMYQKGNPWETEDDFLITLCNVCHEDRHIHEKAAKEMLIKIMAHNKSWLGDLAFSLKEIYKDAVNRNIAVRSFYSDDQYTAQTDYTEKRVREEMLK